jgi:hypothetical protein
MTDEKTPLTAGAHRAGGGEHVFDLARINHIHAGPDYSTSNGSVVEGDRMMVALMRMPANTGPTSTGIRASNGSTSLRGRCTGRLTA